MAIWIETGFPLVLHSRKWEKKSILLLYLCKQNYVKINENQITTLKSNMVPKNVLECSTHCDFTPIIVDILDGINEKGKGSTFMEVNK